ncbi:MAG: PaaI family thioesterase [Myxococcota bacterium]
MGKADIEALILKVFPQAVGYAAITRLEPGALELTKTTDEGHLRPGGTVSGPVLMTLADTAAYFLILAHLGPVALAVTTNLSIDFLRKGDAGQLFARASLLKLGRRLALCQVGLYASAANAEVHVAQATVTYSIPPEKD